MFGEESEAYELCNSLLLKSNCSSSYDSKRQVLWRWTSGEAAGDDSLESVVASLRTSSSGQSISAQLKQRRVQQPLSYLSSLFFFNESSAHLQVSQKELLEQKTKRSTEVQ